MKPQSSCCYNAAVLLECNRCVALAQWVSLESDCIVLHIVFTFVFVAELECFTLNCIVLALCEAWSGLHCIILIILTKSG